MADFRVDKLELHWITAQRYTLTMTVNADNNDGDYEIEGTVTGTELVFYPGNINKNKKIVFTCDNVNFAGFKDDQYLLISVFDNTNTPAAKKKKGGVVIVDTLYPPPRDKNMRMPYKVSAHFQIKELSVERVKADEFKITPTFYFDTTQHNYFKDTFQFIGDTKNSNRDVMIFNVEEREEGGQLVPFPFPAGSDVGAGKTLMLKNYTDGLPLIVAKKGDWAILDQNNNRIVNIKKGMIYIE